MKLGTLPTGTPPRRVAPTPQDAAVLGRGRSSRGWGRPVCRSPGRQERVEVEVPVELCSRTWL